MGNSCGGCLDSVVRVATCKGPRVKVPVRTEPKLIDFSSSIEGKWSFPEVTFSGSYAYAASKQPQIEEVDGTIEEGKEKLESDKETYEGMFYQTNMVDWPEGQQKYSLVRRTGSGFQPKGQGGFTFVRSKYTKLEEEDEIEVEPDDYTDSVLSVYKGQRLGRPVCPGRGQGCADIPDLKIIGVIDPSDVSQGGVGNCWFLSALSALAEFDGAIAKLFQHTDWYYAPQNEFNHYTITLYDVESDEPVDIEIDERLCTKAENGDLLASQPSADGELWGCYVEKAFAAHCGGWDKIDGGAPPFAWRILTGCQDVYAIMGDRAGWGCFGIRDTGSFGSFQSKDWPEVGGGGDWQDKLDSDGLFRRMCDWESHNFILAAGTKSGSDQNNTDGIQDGHAYSILHIQEDVANTGIDMIQLRNPWGKGEFNRGRWIDDGDGWEEFPEIRDALQPFFFSDEVRDDGVFWMDQDEFFKHFTAIYLCAKDMAEFVRS